MKWLIVIQQKLKVAGLLGGIMVLVLGSTLLSKNNMDGMDKSFSSLYLDRLIPAIDMVYLTDNLYRKHLLLERYLWTDKEVPLHEIAIQLDAHNAHIDSLVKEFEKTYLVEEETKSLGAFRNRIVEYASIEQTILNLCSTGQRAAGIRLFEQEGNVAFQRTIIRLNELTRIQSSVGKELVRKSHSDALQSEFLSTFQICMVLIIGLIVLALIKEAKMINIGKQPFHLN